jgi:hypothetical protein
MSRTELTRDLLQGINAMRIGDLHAVTLSDWEEREKGDSVMLWTIAGILLVLWLLGFSMHVGGGLIHALLVIAIVVFLFNLLSGRRSSA